MEYEQKYKEALKVIESLYNVVKYQSSYDALLTTQTIEKAFPELCESEDERIRKGLIRGLSAMRDIHKRTTFSDDAIDIDEAIVWLENQGEQKPYPETLDKAIELYYYSYGNEKGGFDNLSLEKFKDIIKTFVEDYGNKSAWNEEDETNMDYSSEIIGFLKNYIKAHGCTAMNSWVNWLKSLKPNHWKPSEEQMKALNAINLLGELSYVGQGDLLVKLYQDLKNYNYAEI